MKTHPTPIQYPTSSEEELKWGFDVFKPKGIPKAWILDWSGSNPGWEFSTEEMEKIDREGLIRPIEFTLSKATVKMSYYHKHTFLALAEELEKAVGREKAREIMYDYAYTTGKEIWSSGIKQHGVQTPEFMALGQDFGHTMHGPATDAPCWFDDEKMIVCRTRCLYRPTTGAKDGGWCKLLCSAWTVGYMDADPTLYHARVLDYDNPENKGKAPRCVQIWTHVKSAIEVLPAKYKANIDEFEAATLKKRGVKL
jgi:hypothetical protein